MASKSPVDQSTSDAQRDAPPAPQIPSAGPAWPAEDAAPGRPSSPSRTDDLTPFAATWSDRRAAGPPVEPAPGLTEAVGERFALGTEIGRGGMGRVIAAQDRRLGRTVAVKLLLATDAASRHRFEREVLMTAQLQHPGIVPIYDAGTLPSGEIFYAMKLVAGRTLKDLIAERRTLAERLALVPNLLAAAEAVGYAHQHGVVHRDLKPSNIVVGEFGETQIIDWGVAKDLSAASARDPAGERTSNAGPVTSWGAVIGTPAFMAPEQARGLSVDERADVWALGATLYALIAGGAPYAARPSIPIIEQVRRGPPVPLRERTPEAPPDLVAVVDKAMQRDPLRRYAGARELADDLRRFLTGHAVAAHRYSRLERLRRWAGRHRGAIAASAVSMAALAVLAAYSVVRIVRERDVAQSERAAAVNERRAAEELVRFMVGELQVRLQPIGRLDVLEGVGERVDQYYQNVAAPGRPLDDSSRARRADAFDTLSKVRQARGQLEPARNAVEDALALRADLVRAAQRTAGPGAPRIADAQLDLAATRLQRASVLGDLNQLDAAAEDCRAARDLVHGAIGAAPTPAAQRELAAAAELGAILFRQGKYHDAIAAYADGRTAGERLLATASPSPADRRTMARLLVGSGRARSYVNEYPEALAELRSSTRLLEELLAEAPNDATSLKELGTALVNIGAIELDRARVADARPPIERGVDVLRRAVAIDATNKRAQINLGSAIDTLAHVERGAGHPDEALRRYQEALDMTRRMLTQGSSLDLRFNLAVGLQHVGIGAIELRAWPVAVARLREAVDTAQALLADDPQSDRVRGAVANSQLWLGEALVGAGDRRAARAAFERSVADSDQLAARDPASEWPFTAAVVRHRLGSLAITEGRVAAGIALLRAAVHGLEAAGDPPEVEFGPELGLARAELAAALGRGAEATALRDQARAAWRAFRAQPVAYAPLARRITELGDALDARRPATEAR